MGAEALHRRGKRLEGEVTRRVRRVVNYDATPLRSDKTTFRIKRPCEQRAPPKNDRISWQCGEVKFLEEEKVAYRRYVES